MFIYSVSKRTKRIVHVAFPTCFANKNDFVMNIFSKTPFVYYLALITWEKKMFESKQKSGKLIDDNLKNKNNVRVLFYCSS